MTRSYTGTRVLVTGGTGFIGSHLVRALLDSGAEVRALIRPDGDPWRLRDLLSRVILHPADLRDAGTVKELMARIQPEFVFHFASRMDPTRDPHLAQTMLEINLEGTRNLLSAARKKTLKCFIHTGTCEEYGTNMPPFVETQRPIAVSPYSASKIKATEFCLEDCGRFEIPIVILRPFVTYGPGQTGSMLIPSLMTAWVRGEAVELTAGEQTRDFIYVDDIVQGYLAAGMCPQAKGEIINLASGTETSVRDIAFLIGRLSGRPDLFRLGALPYRDHEIMRLVGSGEKARRLLGWTPKVSLEEGLRRTHSWFFQSVNQNRERVFLHG